MEIAVGEEEQWGLLKARLIFGLLSPALSLCGPTRDGEETVRSQPDYSAPAAFEREDRMSQKTLLCDRSQAQQSSLRAFVWKPDKAGCNKTFSWLGRNQEPHFLCFPKLSLPFQFRNK